MKRGFGLIMMMLLMMTDGWPITLDGLLKKHYQARGGLERLQSIRTVKIEGTLIQHNMNMSMNLTMWYAKPRNLRVEVEFRNQTIVQGYDGERVWWIMPFEGCKAAQEMPEDQAAEIIKQAESMEPLVEYKQLGHTLELMGLEMMEGIPVYKLKMTRVSGDVTWFYLDKATALELKIASLVKRGDNEILVETLPSDYRKVDEILVPFKLETRIDGKSAADLLFRSYSFNLEMEDSLFSMPKPDTLPDEAPGR